MTTNSATPVILNPKSNAVKRKRPSHRKPPRTNYDSTSPLGVLTSFEIPNLLKLNKDKINELTGLNKEEWLINDVINPVRDIINDKGILDAFNWREIKDVEILGISSKGDGLGIVKAPLLEDILKCQEIVNEREWNEIKLRKLNDPNSSLIPNATSTVNSEGIKKRNERRERDEPYRRKIEEDKIPKIQIVTVPFTYPGDIVDIKIYHTNEHFIDGEVIKFNKLSELRESVNCEDPYDKVPCAYFGICSGCQYQTLDYENQLIIKREVVENAYKHFCGDSINWKGKIEDTVESPLKFGYRTKLTPHYDIPRSGTKGLGIPRLGFGWKSKGVNLKISEEDDVNNDKIYDNSKLELRHSNELKLSMRRRAVRPYFGDVLDIEDCIIGTDIVRLGLVDEREKLKNDWNNDIKSKKGVTILLRENNIIIEEEEEENEDKINEILNNSGSSKKGDKVTTIINKEKFEGKQIINTCVTNNQKIVSDLVDTGLGRKLRFDFIANEFFQNNNSILPKIIKYVKDKLSLEIEYLVDAYCGSGLFSVSIGSIKEDKECKIKKILGVEISEKAVEFAKMNAELNNISKEHCDFIQGKAEKLFEHINFNKDKTGVILDPPRKGCDEIFLKQLSEFEPLRIVYVSCNVHSQARDVKYFINETVNGSKYEVESIRGFDFFPQTHHVESVAVLVKKE